MKISSLEEYGLRCMLLFTRQNSGTPFTLPQISNDEALSVPYAAKLLMILKKADLVRAVRGRKGGYILARSAEQISVGEILRALGEGFFSKEHCLRFSGDDAVCIHNNDCSIREIWSSFERLFTLVLGRITLADLANRGFSFKDIIRIGSGEIETQATN